MRLLLRAFPATFRRRYGDELLELVAAGNSPLRDGANIVLAGLRVRAEAVAGWARRRGALTAGTVAAAVGSVALGGCLVLGSAATGGAGFLLAWRWRQVTAAAA